MIYCPHCNKPSARSSGACPHCGKSLAGSLPPAAPEQSGTASATGSRFGGSDFELDDEAAGGSLELAGDDYVAPQDSATQNIPGLGDHGDPGPAPAASGSTLQLADVDETRPSPRVRQPAGPTDIGDDEIRSAAGFGSPRPGPIAAISYALKVRGRLKQLGEQHDRATESERAAVERLASVRAELGRKARDAGFAAGELEALVQRAARVDSELSGAQSRRKGLESQHRDRQRELVDAIARIDEEAIPIRRQEAEASRRLDQLRTDRKRAMAQLRRAEIERRNLKGMIEQRQQAYSDLKKPQDEREMLLAEIARFDKELEPVNERIEQHRREMATFDKPIADAETALTAVRGQVSEKTAQVSALRGEVDQLKRSFEQEAGGATAAVEEEVRRAEHAWATVGERVFAELGRDGPLAQEREAVAAALERVDDVRRRLELLTRARESYDHGVVKRAKQYAVFAGILLMVFVGVAIYFSITV